MKKIFLMVFVSMIILSPAYADEEIQLAAVLSASGSSDIQANKRLYATDVNQLSISPGSKPDYEFGIVAGIVVAGTIAIIAAGGSDSTSNH